VQHLQRQTTRQNTAAAQALMQASGKIVSNMRPMLST
jgi:hypothetical protein